MFFAFMTSSNVSII